jgi:hypothetical protein
VAKIDIKSEFSYIICSYLRRLVIQNSLKCTDTSDFFRSASKSNRYLFLLIANVSFIDKCIYKKKPITWRYHLDVCILIVDSYIVAVEIRQNKRVYYVSYGCFLSCCVTKGDKSKLIKEQTPGWRRTWRSKSFLNSFT